MVGAQVTLAAGLGLAGLGLGESWRAWQASRSPSEPSGLMRPMPVLGQVSRVGLALGGPNSTSEPWHWRQPAIATAGGPPDDLASRLSSDPGSARPWRGGSPSARRIRLVALAAILGGDDDGDRLPVVLEGVRVVPSPPGDSRNSSRLSGRAPQDATPPQGPHYPRYGTRCTPCPPRRPRLRARTELEHRVLPHQIDKAITTKRKVSDPNRGSHRFIIVPPNLSMPSHAKQTPTSREHQARKLSYMHR